MVYKVDFIQLIQYKVAISSISINSVRNYGKGVLKIIHDFLKNLNLKEIPKSKEDFVVWLNKTTDELCSELNKYSELDRYKTEFWGLARKALNLFLRDVFYNRYLYEKFSLARLEYWLEIPLDNIVAKRLYKESKLLEKFLPKWCSLISLNSETNKAYQDFAQILAQKLGIARVHLDLYFWLLK